MLRLYNRVLCRRLTANCSYIEYYILTFYTVDKSIAIIVYANRIKKPNSESNHTRGIGFFYFFFLRRRRQRRVETGRYYTTSSLQRALHSPEHNNILYYIKHAQPVGMHNNNAHTIHTRV